MRKVSNKRCDMSRADEIFIANSQGYTDKRRVGHGAGAPAGPTAPGARFGSRSSRSVNPYDLSEEFPILTIRRTLCKSALMSFLWIWQAKRNNVNELVHAFGMRGRTRPAPSARPAPRLSAQR